MSKAKALIPTIPNIPIPAQLRSALLKKATWDYLRTKLSYDQALAVKPETEAAIALVLEDAIAKGLGEGHGE